VTEAIEETPSLGLFVAAASLLSRALSLIRELKMAAHDRRTLLDTVFTAFSAGLSAREIAQFLGRGCIRRHK